MNGKESSFHGWNTEVCKATGSFAEPFPVHIHVQSNCPPFIEARKNNSARFGHNICNIKCCALRPGRNRLCSRPSLTVGSALVYVLALTRETTVLYPLRWRCQLVNTVWGPSTLASAAKRVRVYVSIGPRKKSLREPTVGSGASRACSRVRIYIRQVLGIRAYRVGIA